VLIKGYQNECENDVHDPDGQAPTVIPILRTLALPAVLVVALSSCGTSPSPGAAGPQTSAASGATSGTGSAPTASAGQFPVGPPATGSSNPADVDFAMAMTANHLQAAAIADLAPGHAKDNKIKALAAKVKKSNGPELTAMTGWLVGGGIPVPDAMGGHDMSGMGGAKMPVVISPQEMAALGKATGSGFDRMWLQLMLKSHQGALTMARTELAKGLNPDARKIATSVVERQSAEIATMTPILTGLAKR